MAERQRKRTKKSAATEPAPGELTMAELRRRAELAGVAIDEDRWELTLQSVNTALAPVRALRSREHRELEPAVRFQAGQAGGA